MRDALPGEGHVVAGADLADPDAVRRMVDEVAGALGGIDVLVNNAGVFEPHAATETTLRGMAGGVEAHAGRQPDRRGQRHLVRAAPHGRRRAHRQRLLARGFPGRAQPSGLRRQQGGADRVRAVAGPRARRAADLGHGGGAGLRGDRHGGEPSSRARAAGGGAPRARSAAWPRPRRSRPPCTTWPRPRRSWPAARCSTSTAPPTCACEPSTGGSQPRRQLASRDVPKDKIPTSRVGRTARIGGLAAGQAIRQAGTRAANVTRVGRAAQGRPREAPDRGGRADRGRAGDDEGRGDEGRAGAVVPRRRPGPRRVPRRVPAQAGRAARRGAQRLPSRTCAR